MRRTFFTLVLLVAASAFAQVDAGARLRFAVLYFDAPPTDPDLREFATGFASMLISDLSANEQLRVIERERLEDAMKELKLGETRFADKSSFAKVGKLLGADYLLMGSLLRDKARNQVYVNARLISPETGDTWGWQKIIVASDDVVVGEEEVVKQTTSKLLQLGVLTRAAEPPKKAFKLPAKTFQTYSKALEAKDKKDTATATKLLGEVVKDQPDFKLAQLDLNSLTK